MTRRVPSETLIQSALGDGNIVIRVYVEYIARGAIFGLGVEHNLSVL